LRVVRNVDEDHDNGADGDGDCTAGPLRGGTRSRRSGLRSSRRGRGGSSAAADDDDYVDDNNEEDDDDLGGFGRYFQ
jgi:hypothetical protein